MPVQGGNVTREIQSQFIGTITGGAGSTGVFASFASPFPDNSVLIHQVILRVQTQSTGAATLDIGIAADATTASDTMFDAISVAVAGVYNPAEHGGTNGVMTHVLGPTQFINVKEDSGDVNALVADLWIDYSVL